MKMRRKLGRLCMVLVLLMLGGWVGQADPQATFGRLSWLVYDAVQQWMRPEPYIDQRIVIVDIDDDSLREQGRWPWPREQLAALIDAIQQAGPAQIGLDILLPERSTPKGDAELAKRLQADNLVAATAFGNLEAASRDTWPSAMNELAPAKMLRDDVSGRPGIGHISPQPSADGHIRWLYPRVCGPADCHSTLALAMLEQFVALPAELQQHSAIRRFCVGGFCQQVDAQRRLLLAYQHPSRFRYLSAAEVMAGSHQEQLKGALVLVGTSAAGLGDLVATPRGALTPGVELHAIMLASWLDSQSWALLPSTRLWQWSGLLSLALIAWFGLPTGQSSQKWWTRGMLVTMVSLVVLPLALMSQGYWFDPWPWWFAVTGNLLIWLGVERWWLWRRHRRLYRAFGAYVPRNVLRQLAQQSLGNAEAQRMPLVIMFTDIRGFTELSDTLPPERLIELTNHIFSELTEVVHQSGGTLDKYIGDAMMAFWGAPLPHADDPQRALDCALAIQQRLLDINVWCEQQGFPAIAMNIGMEAGEVTVGNLGSRQRRAYTAMGRAVNLASRLEELAASQCQPIVVGPGLAAELDGNATLIPYMQAELKGLREPVTVSIPATYHVDSDCISSSDT